MNNEVDTEIAKLSARRAELKWLQIRTAQLPRALAEELALSERFIAAAAGVPARTGHRETARGSW